MRPTEVLRSATLIAAALLFPAAASADPAVPAPVGQQWNSTWSDEFNNASSNAANNTGDFAGFSYDTGGGGWGNQELETYTTNAANVSVGSEGALHLTAIGSTSGGNTTYTSARIKTPTLFSQTYGLFEFRAKLPVGNGLWPALWMMPKTSAYGSWPTSGEIDVLESNANGQHNTAQGSLHTGSSPGTQYTQTTTYYGPGGTSSHPTLDTTTYHTYDLQWAAGSDSNHPSSLTWYVDGSPYETITGGWVIPSGHTASAPFDQPFYLIMNLAVGGTYVNGASPGAGSYEMDVDYVRAYQLGAQTVPEPGAVGTLSVAAALAITSRRRRHGR